MRHRNPTWSLPNIISGLCVAVLLVSGIRFGWYSLNSLLYPYATDYMDGFILDQARTLSRGEQLYTTLEQYPYLHVAYPPLYQFVLSLLLPLLQPTYWWPRLISLACTLATAALLMKWARTKSASSFVTSLAPGLLLSLPPIVIWATAVRVDLLGLFLSVSGLLLLALRPKTRSTVWWSVILFTLSIFTKPTFILAGPVAAVGLIWHHYSPKMAGYFILTLGGLGGLVLVLLMLLTEGQFYLHTIQVNALMPFSWKPVLDQLRLFGTALPFLSIIFGYSLTRKGYLTTRNAWIWLYAIVTCLSFVQYGRVGSNSNYFLELSVAITLLTVDIVVWFQTKNRQLVPLLSLLLVQLIWLLVVGSQLFPIPFHDHQDHYAATALKLVQTAPGPVLADGNISGLVPLSGKQLVIEPYPLTELAKRGLWNDDELVQMVREQRFSLIAIEDGSYRWTEDFLQAVSEFYQPKADLVGCVFWVPRLP